MYEQNKLLSVELNHLIILAKDKQKTADFLTQLLNLPNAKPADGPLPNFFLSIQFKNDITILIAEAKEYNMGHYAFKVSHEDFEQIIQRLKDWNINYWADPRMQRKSECYLQNGNKGLYVIDPSGHGIEILTQLDIHE
jgi:catechol 2,3-dioxygenase-like lactoylglutathione lyase family enzyme